MLEVDWRALCGLVLTAPLLVAAVLGRRSGKCRLHVWIALQGRRYRSVQRFVEVQRPMPSEWRDAEKRRRFDDFKEACEQGACLPLQRAMALSWVGIFVVVLGLKVLWGMTQGGAA